MKHHIDFTKTTARIREKYQMIAEVCEEFAARGRRLTVRQIFYQLVAKGRLENTPANYQFMIRWATEARERGYVDWDHLEDRIRQCARPFHVSGLRQGLETLKSQYRLDRQNGQAYHFEVWWEKDAASEILEPMARKYGMPSLCGHGQFSLPCFNDALHRFERDPRPVHIFYFGDHDPTGILSLEENIRKKFAQLLPDREIEVDRVAVPLRALASSPLHKRLIPCPVKEDDVMTPQYRELYGDTSWELEALSEEELQSMFQDAVDDFLDSEAYLKVVAAERRDSERLTRLIKGTRR